MSRKTPSLLNGQNELQTRVRQQEALAKLTQRVLESSNIEALLDNTVHLVSQAMNVDCYALIEHSLKQEHLLLRTGDCWNGDEQMRVRIIDAIKSEADFTLSVNGPVIVENYSTEERFPGSELMAGLGMTGSLSVVIPARTGPFGVLAVYTQQLATFTLLDANFLQSMANVLATAIQRIRSESAVGFSRDQLSIILEGAADGIIVQDRNNRLLFGNQAAAHMLGCESQEELLNTPSEDILQKFEIQDENGNPYEVGEFPSRLVLQGKPDASAVIRYKKRESDQENWALVKARPIINLNRQVEMAVSILHDITQLKQDEAAQIFLAEVGKILSSSLDYLTTLNGVANLAANRLADWCVVDVLEEDESVHQLVVAHRDAEKVNRAKELQERYPTDWEAAIGAPNVLRTGRAEFYPEISEDLLESITGNQEQLNFLRQMGLRSGMIMPLINRGQTFGVITLVWAESKRRYTETDLILAEELARRASVAIDNARLYREAQRVNSELEARVTKRTEQLHSLIETLRSEIEERKKAEEDLHRSETILATLFEAAPDGHVLMDTDGYIVRMNAQVEELFGYQRNDLIGKSIETLLPERYRTRHVLHRLTYLNEPHLRTMGAGLELSARRRDGSEFAVEVMLSPVRTENETLVIAAIRDISERKEMEAELAEVQRRLIENIEAERLSLAQELHDGPIQDLYGISYSLNAMDQGLEGIIGDNGLKEALGTSKQMTQQVIDFLRSISGELRPPALAPYGLEKAIRAHIETIQQANPDLDVELDLVPDGQVLPERIRLTLYRIYQSAVRNVIRHANAKKINVRLVMDDSQIQLAVEDDGCGFELPSHWVVLARSGHFGLVGTYERVQAMGGDLKIRTAPGEGTLLQVSLPRANLIEL